MNNIILKNSQTWILAFIAIFAVVLVLQNKYKYYFQEDEQEKENKLIQQFLLNDSPIYGYNKPKLWIHSKFEVNARKWKSFLSRNTTDLNQPYLFLTIQSIVFLNLMKNIIYCRFHKRLNKFADKSCCSFVQQ